MPRTLYEETSRNPFASRIRLGEHDLVVGGRRTPLAELNLTAMADAYLRGQWLGGGGTERPLAWLRQERGVVPVIRVTGAAQPLRPRNAAEFARAGRVGGAAQRRSGGRVRGRGARGARGRAAVDRAPHGARPARRGGGHGGPAAGAGGRVGDGLPAVRLRGSHSLTVAALRVPVPPLAVTVGGEPATLSVVRSALKSRRAVKLRTRWGDWELRRQDYRRSVLLCDGRRVALLGRPDRSELRGRVVLPLARVELASADPLDVVLAHFFAVVCGLGDGWGGGGDGGGGDGGGGDGGGGGGGGGGE
ncbi:hypothetical protein [Streptomyces litchfieldiae]|uniref:Uncharacterized protein n=1 Tax=Streptomyces litchfieldiae TaxID=3075543 RepID=A0ABU2MKM9_9ACTN|nr:hypothetical protein [Streptomyces sp. DSM 44938]MDT0341997.1 hypothetical protein [Streptomyces sp. DSM 44938]